MVVLFLILLLFAVPASSQVEQRCTDLGTDCFCSEILDYDDDSGSGSFDPPDSEGVGAKECFNGPCVFRDSVGTWTTTTSVENHADLDIPGAYSGRVQKMNSGSSDFNYFLYGGPHASLENETVCLRYYFRCDPDFGTGTADTRFKTSQFLGDSGGVKQSQLSHSSPFTGWDMFGETSCSGSLTNVDWWAACKTSWIRLEHCMDIGSGSGITLGFRVRLTEVDTPANQSTRTCSTNDTYTTPVSATHAGDFGADMLIQRNGEPGFTNMDRYITHYMETRAAEDSNFWIGAASEIEDPANSFGASGGSSVSQIHGGEHDRISRTSH